MIARVTTESPPTCDSGQARQPHVVSVDTESRRRRDGRSGDRLVRQHDALGQTGGAAGRDDEGITGLDLVAVDDVRRRRSSINRSGRMRREHCLAGVMWQPSIEWKRGVTVVPYPPQRVDELARLPADRSQRGAARSEGYGDARESVDHRRSSAHAPCRCRAGRDRCRCCRRWPQSPVWWRVGPALIVSLALQIGVNYSNDYSDGIRGTDDVRVGPMRLVAGGLAEPSQVKRAAFAAFGVAAVAGLVLAIATTWWLIVVGLLAMLAGWGYTGGPKPYGYMGLGELFVFVFFGLVATVGTTYVVIEGFPAHAWLAGCAAGFLACALLVVNNLRDIPTDRTSGKRTLAVRLGDGRTRWLYVGMPRRCRRARSWSLPLCGEHGRRSHWWASLRPFRRSLQFVAAPRAAI